MEIASWEKACQTQLCWGKFAGRASHFRHDFCPFAMPPATHHPADPLVLLVDNGSLAPAATLSLRTLAAQLTAAVGREIHPVSLLHSSAVDPALLEGSPAEILEPALRWLASEGRTNIIVLPLFLGPSAALTEYLPERIRHLRQTWPTLQVRVAPCLVNARDPSDHRVAAMLVDNIQAVAKARGWAHPAVAVVDHGSPQRAVTAVRDLVAKQVETLLGGQTRRVTACSMERRPGPAYDFNEPLLAKLLDESEFSTGKVIIARLFLQPGRHAGPDGDIEQIARAAEVRHSGLRLALTEPLASHPGLIPLLAERLEQGRHSEARVIN
jgi:sirohydrochlorin ferrochelatase